MRFNMVSILPIFCVFLAIGLASVGGHMTDEEKAEMKRIVEECKNEGHEAPVDKEDAMNDKYKCFHECMLVKSKQMKDGELTLSEKMPKRDEITACYNEKKGDLSGECPHAMLVFQCMKEAHSEE